MHSVVKAVPWTIGSSTSLPCSHEAVSLRITIDPDMSSEWTSVHPAGALWLGTICMARGDWVVVCMFDGRR